MFVRPMTVRDWRSFLLPQLGPVATAGRILLRAPAYAIEHRGAVVACCGIASFYPGSGEAWALVHPNAPAVVYRYIRDVWITARDSGIFRRIQANVNGDDPKAIRLAEHLGFVEEGRMPRFGPKGETYVRYVVYP